MSLSIRTVSTAQAALNTALTQINPILPGESIEVYATSPVTDTTVVAIGTKMIFQGVAPLETLATQGPLIPDHLVAKWTQPMNSGSADLTITVAAGTTATDLLIVKS